MSKYSCPQNTLSFAQWQLGVPSVPLCCSDTVSKIMIILFSWISPVMQFCKRFHRSYQRMRTMAMWPHWTAVIFTVVAAIILITCFC